MFAYILRAKAAPDDVPADLFARFKETPGLLSAYDLQGEQDPNDGVVVAIWESREAAMRYLDSSSLRREADETVPNISRTFYRVLDSK